jgi:hypothetical protein
VEGISFTFIVSGPQLEFREKPYFEPALVSPQRRLSPARKRCTLTAATAAYSVTPFAGDRTSKIILKNKKSLLFLAWLATVMAN